MPTTASSRSRTTLHVTPELCQTGWAWSKRISPDLCCAALNLENMFVSHMLDVPGDNFDLSPQNVWNGTVQSWEYPSGTQPTVHSPTSFPVWTWSPSDMNEEGGSVCGMCCTPGSIRTLCETMKNGIDGRLCKTCGARLKYGRCQECGPSGLGDTIAKATSALGIPPCAGCQKRVDWLNEKLPYRG